MSTIIIDPTRVIPPNQAGYGHKPGKQIVVEQLEGGSPRTRRDQLGAADYVTCVWSCTPAQYQYLTGFFREMINGYADQFRVNLVLDVPFLVPYLCTLMEEPELSRIDGLLYEVSAKLSVLPNPIRSFSVRFNNATLPRFIDTGTTQYAGNLSEFPVGRSVQICGSRQLVNGVDINLDGVYGITTAVSVFIREMSGAAGVNPAWTTLNGTVAQETANGFGAVILLPL